MLRRPFVRKIQVDIVTIFIILIFSSSLSLIFYAYYKDYNGMLKFSDPIIRQITGGVVQKLASTADRAEKIGEVTKSLVTKSADVSIDNTTLISYLINRLKYDQTLFSISLATVDGSLLAAYDLTNARMTHYHSRPADPLPEGVKYALRTIIHTETVSCELWRYLGTDLQVLTTESLTSLSYDPRTDPLFIDEMRWPHVHWGYVDRPDLGTASVTVSVPALDPQGNMFVLASIDLSLSTLSNFLSLSDIGQTGSAFVLDSNGTILIPLASDLSTAGKGISAAVVESAYAKFEKEKQTHFLSEVEGVKYLVNVADFPISLESKWFVLSVIPFNDFFGTILKTQHQTVLISIGFVLIFGFIVYFSSKHISEPIVQLAKEVDKIKQFDFTEFPPIDSRIEEVIILDSSIRSLRNALSSFGRYVPTEIVRTLINKGQAISLGGERKEITVMFSDIKDFTTVSEAFQIDKVIELLTQYFDVLSKIILENQGTIDKYIGDSIMSFWNAPQDVVDHPTKACLTSLYSLKACQKMKEAGSPIWETRFGIHTGEVLVGNIGTLERMNYTIIGNVVNAAARLQTINKEYKTSIIISSAILENTGAQFVTRPLDFVAVKGKKHRLAIYELIGTAARVGEIMATEEQKELAHEFSEAFTLFHDGKLQEAKKHFLALQSKFPSDYPTSLYLKRVEEMLNLT